MGNLINLGAEEIAGNLDGKNYKHLILNNTNSVLSTDLEINGPGYLQTALITNRQQNSNTTPQIKITVDGVVLFWACTTTGYSGAFYSLGLTGDLFGGYSGAPVMVNKLGHDLSVGSLFVKDVNFPLPTLQVANGGLFLVPLIKFNTSLKVESRRQTNQIATLLEYYLD